MENEVSSSSNLIPGRWLGGTPEVPSFVDMIISRIKSSYLRENTADGTRSGKKEDSW